MNRYSNNPIIDAHVDRLLPIGEPLGAPEVQEISINSRGAVKFVSQNCKHFQTKTQLSTTESFTR